MWVEVVGGRYVVIREKARGEQSGLKHFNFIFSTEGIALKCCRRSWVGEDLDDQIQKAHFSAGWIGGEQIRRQGDCAEAGVVIQTRW